MKDTLIAPLNSQIQYYWISPFQRQLKLAEKTYLSINIISKDRLNPKRNFQLLFGLIPFFVPTFSNFLLRKTKGLIPIIVRVKHVIILPNIIGNVIHVI